MNPDNPDLSGVPSHELQAELARRDAEARARREAETKRREVRVLCPTCRGSGRVSVRDWQSGYVLDGRCGPCSGSGRITAISADC